METYVTSAPGLRLTLLVKWCIVQAGMMRASQLGTCQPYAALDVLAIR